MGINGLGLLMSVGNLLSAGDVFDIALRQSVTKGKTCVSCAYEPAWEEVGEDRLGYPQLEGECRAPRAMCDIRHKLHLDTEYMWVEPTCGIKGPGDCPMWKEKER